MGAKVEGGRSTKHRFLTGVLHVPGQQEARIAGVYTKQGTAEFYAPVYYSDEKKKYIYRSRVIVDGQYVQDTGTFKIGGKRALQFHSLKPKF